VRRIGIWAIHAYRFLFAWLPSSCRYEPSCSRYAIEAIELHGPGRGLVLAMRRLARCQPWGGFGFDPVPRPSDAVRF